VSLEVADGAVQVLGGHGYTREYLPEMHMRNAQGFSSFEGLALV
jgi:alkylation response protein AidB-like acyl-CoA dehydrogenase